MRMPLIGNDKLNPLSFEHRFIKSIRTRNTVTRDVKRFGL